MENNFNLKKFLVENKLTTNSKALEESKIPLDIIQDMYKAASTVDQGYEPDHDVKGAEDLEKEYKLKYPKEYNFVSDVSAEDEYAEPGSKMITDEEALKAVGYTLDQIRDI